MTSVFRKKLSQTNSHKNRLLIFRAVFVFFTILTVFQAPIGAGPKVNNLGSAQTQPTNVDNVWLAGKVVKNENWSSGKKFGDYLGEVTLEGVTVCLATGDTCLGPDFMTTTNQLGVFYLPVLDQSKNYRVIAKEKLLNLPEGRYWRQRRRSGKVEVPIEALQKPGNREKGDYVYDHISKKKLKKSEIGYQNDEIGGVILPMTLRPAYVDAFFKFKDANTGNNIKGITSIKLIKKDGGEANPSPNQINMVSDLGDDSYLFFGRPKKR